MASLVEAHGHAGDEGNFEALYRTYKSEVQRLASYLLRNAADAEDASQTVFLNVLRALREGVKPADPRAWLLAITRNVCFSRRRTAARRPDEVELDPEAAGHHEENSGPSAEDIVGALARMQPNQRTALILRDFRGVPRTEISELMRLSPAGVEALLTRARTSFREELEADRQPFDCADTRALVEQQLEGLIAVAARHSLRSHLRHCSPCSTLARAVRSSRGKLAGLLFWPGELISRLASALSQAPAAAHVAAALSTTAAVASVAIPIAILEGPTTTHVEGRAAPGLAAVVHHTATRSSRVVSTRAVPSTSRRVASHEVARSPVTGRPLTRKTNAHKPTRHARPHLRPHAIRSATPVTAPSTTTPISTRPTGTTPAIRTTPASISPQQAPPEAAALTPIPPQPMSLPSRSSPPARLPPTGSPPAPAAKPKPAHKGSKHRKNGRRAPAPTNQTPTSSPAPALPPPQAGAGSSVVTGVSVPPAGTASGSSSSASSSKSSGSASSANSTSSTGGKDSSDTGHGNGHKH